jgi:uncharacterized protein YlaN (UPF0358 family)
LSAVTLPACPKFTEMLQICFEPKEIDSMVKAINVVLTDEKLRAKLIEKRSWPQTSL